MLDPAPCSDISRSLDEPLCGTASRVRAWLLLEQPGEWARDAVISSELGEALGRELKKATAPHGIRVVLLRRADGSRSEHPAAYLVFSGLEDRWALRIDIAHPSEILDMDLSPIASGDRPLHGEEHEDALYLVCTHAQHDACCGRRGPAIARALAEMRPEQTWECSHIGGDRFAANLVCLPHGLYFGRVTDPVRTIEMYERQRIDLAHYRGRSCYEPVVQAAEVMLRSRHGIDGFDELTPEERSDHGGGSSTLAFRTAAGEQLTIRLHVDRAEKRRLVCEAVNPGRPRRFTATD